MNDAISVPGQSAELCKNCGLKLTRRYCSACSQDSEEGTPSAREWIFEAFAEFTSLEGRTIRSFGKLIGAPGELTVAWKEGKRVRYTRPLRLVLFSLVLLLLIRSVLGSERGFLASAVLGILEGATGGLGAVDEATVLYETSRILRWFTLALAPIVAAVVSIFFRRRAFSEHFVFTLHVIAFTLLLRTLFSIVELVVASEYVTESIQVVVMFIYALVAMSRVYGESLLVTSAKFIAIAILSVTIWTTAGVTIVAIALNSV